MAIMYKSYKAYCPIDKDDIPIRSCGTCKHTDKKITEEPCMICSPYCDKWEKKDN